MGHSWSPTDFGSYNMSLAELERPTLGDALQELARKSLLIRFMLFQANACEQFIAELISAPGEQGKPKTHMLHIRAEVWRNPTTTNTTIFNIHRFDVSPKADTDVDLASWIDIGERNTAWQRWLVPEPFVGVTLDVSESTGRGLHAVPHVIQARDPVFTFYLGILHARLELAATCEDKVITTAQSSKKKEALIRMLLEFNKFLGQAHPVS